MLIIDKLANDLVHWGRLVWEKGSGPPYPFSLYDVAFCGGGNRPKPLSILHLGKFIFGR